uniref:Hemolysin Xhl n=1 Tax=Geladintestivirus 3 TaxID=3233135 RepID=A0AAU8MIC7_9CAUD
MIVLLSCSIDSSSKSYIPFTGRIEKDSVTIAISDIRKANAKLIELQYEKDINKNLRQIIVNDSILAEQARQRYLVLDRSCKKVKKERNAAFGGASVAILLLILSLLK